MSTTTAEPETIQQDDTDLFTELEEAWEIPCDIPRLNAELGKGFPVCHADRAEWIGYRSCCPQSPRFILLCTSCKETFQKWGAHRAALACGWCGEPTDGPVRFVPLRQAA